MTRYHFGRAHVRMTGKCVLDEPATDTILVKGLPDDATDDALRERFKEYGKIVSVVTVPGQGCGVVQFSNPVPVDDVMDADSIEVAGTTVEVQRVVANEHARTIPFAHREGSADTRLNTVIMRGACTRTGLGVAALLAQAKTTVLVLWDRRQGASEENNVSKSLRRPVYGLHENEAPEMALATKASDSFGASKQKCALVHIVSDQIAEQCDFKDPFYQPNELLRSQALNHLETSSAFLAAQCYYSYITSFRATCFMVLPTQVSGNRGGFDDMCTSCVQVHRLVESDPMRSPDGSGWTIGLQLTSEDAVVNSSLVYGAMTKVAAEEGTRHLISGRVITLDNKAVKYLTEPPAQRPVVGMSIGN